MVAITYECPNCHQHGSHADGCASYDELPALDTEGEWRVSGFEVETGARGRMILDADGYSVAWAEDEQIAARIVADHKAAKSQALLIEVLRGVSIMLNTELKSFESEPWAQRVRAALKQIPD